MNPGGSSSSGHSPDFTRQRPGECEGVSKVGAQTSSCIAGLWKEIFFLFGVSSRNAEKMWGEGGSRPEILTSGG